MDEPINLLATVATFGQPYHGQIVGNTLTTVAGQTIGLPAEVMIDGYLGYTTYVNFGMPALAANEREMAAGVEWHCDAIFFGYEGYYSPKSAVMQLGPDSYLYRAPSGTRWKISVAAALVGDVNPLASAVSPPWTVRFTVVAQPFGYLDGGAPSYSGQIMSADVQVAYASSWSMDPAVGFSAYFDSGAPENRAGIVYPAPDGHVALLHLFASAGGVRVQHWVPIKIWALTLSEPTSGALPAAAIAVHRSESQCISGSYTYSETPGAVDVTYDTAFTGDAPGDVATVTVALTPNGLPMSISETINVKWICQCAFAADGEQIETALRCAGTRNYSVATTASGGGSQTRDSNGWWNGAVEYNAAKTISETKTAHDAVLRDEVEVAATTSSNTRTTTTTWASSSPRASWNAGHTSYVQEWTGATQATDAQSISSSPGASFQYSESSSGSDGAPGSSAPALPSATLVGDFLQGSINAEASVTGIFVDVDHASNNVVRTIHRMINGSSGGQAAPVSILAAPGAVMSIGQAAALGSPFYASWNPRTGAIHWSITSPVGWV